MKKLLSFLLALVLVFSCVPPAAAEEVPSATVYLSVSKKNDFQQLNGKTMALYELTVPYFDLALYGLEKYYYNPDCYAGGSPETQKAGTAQMAKDKITMLHVLIYATEVIYHNLKTSQAGKGWLADQGAWQGFSTKERVGSVYCTFWDFGNNANYYLNYEYPLGRANWGATCDQILVKTGDVISVRYNANTGNDGTYYLFGTAEESFLGVDRGEKVTLQLYATSADYNNGGITRHEPVKSATNVYVTKDKAPTNHASLTKFGTTDSSGKITLDTSKLAPGLYYVTTNTWDPAVVVLEVFGDIVYGDLTGDGEVDVFDASRAYAIVNGKRTATEAELAAIDVNGDEDIDVFDAAMIYAYANGKRSSFPVESK